MTASTTKSYRAINLAEKVGLIGEQWSPRVVAELNDYQFKVVRIEGDFIWHDHPETDEAFLVLDGELRSISGMARSCSGRANCTSSPKAWSTSRSRRARSR
jgi:hypothetical protein